jgi:transposase
MTIIREKNKNNIVGRIIWYAIVVLFLAWSFNAAIKNSKKRALRNKTPIEEEFSSLKPYSLTFNSVSQIKRRDKGWLNFFKIENLKIFYDDTLIIDYLEREQALDHLDDFIIEYCGDYYYQTTGRGNIILNSKNQEYSITLDFKKFVEVIDGTEINFSTMPWSILDLEEYILENFERCQ